MILQGKRVLITGAAKRIGSVIAQELANAGCQVIIHCHSSRQEAETLAGRLPGNGHEVIQSDLATDSGVKNLIRQAGVFELLVNSAAIFHRPGSPEDIAAEKLYEKINFLAPKQLLEYLFALGSPCAAVNITDCHALQPGNGAYWQSKRKLNELTTALAPVWATRRCRINAIAPGPMIPPPWAPESRMEKVLQSVPLSTPVAPEYLAALTRFMLECDSMTGTIVPLDGGISAAAMTHIR